MVIFLGIFLNFCIGLIFVLCARDRIRVDGPFPMPPFFLVLMFVGAIEVPLAIYLYWIHPAWSWLYIVDPAGVPDMVLLLIILVQCSAVIGAWYLGARLLLASQDRPLLYTLIGNVVLLLLLIAVCSGRLAQYGSYQQYQAGDTAGLLDVKLGYVLIALVLGLAAGAGFVGVELMRNSRRVRAK